LRGQSATVEFKLEASIPVYLDNVFFQSESLRFSNPTTARTDLLTNNTYQNNYLIEKPQYTVSYNGKKNTPNWVSWVLDGSWPGNIKSKDRPGEFAVDPDLNSPFYQVAHKDYNFDSQINYEKKGEYDLFNLEKPAIFWPVRGHMSASNDRNRSIKDMYASFLTTNIVPQDAKGNGGAWSSLEDKLQKLARLKNEQGQPTPYKFYISSGVYGAGGGELTKYSTPPTVTVLNERGRVVEAPLKDNPNSFENFKTADGDRTITVPSALWKVVLGFKPNSTSDKPDYYFAFWMPNNSYEIQKSLDYTTKDAKGNIIVKNNTLGWEERLIPIGKLEEIWRLI
jgi:DNA/RNA endonuclease G (NUC1)